MHEVGREMIRKFVKWVNILDHLGRHPSPESLRTLVEDFISELRSSDKGRKDMDGNGEGKTGVEVAWDLKDQGKTLRQAFNEK